MSTASPIDRSPTGPAPEPPAAEDPSRADHRSTAGPAAAVGSAGPAAAVGAGDAWVAPAGPTPRRRRLHHLALAIVLLAVLPVTGTGAVWSADEGALLYQATAVIDGQGWTFDHPFPEADPDGIWFPIHLSSVAAEGGYVVLGKHTVFVWLAGALHGAGGYPAVLGLSVLAALAGAAAASRLAGRMDRRAALPALWLTGVASPLFLSTYVAWAHTLAAALVGWGLVGLTSAWPIGPTTDRLRPSPIGAAQIAGAGALGSACLLRTEAALAAIAATMALVVVPVFLARVAGPSNEANGGRRLGIGRVGLARLTPSGLGPGVLAGGATVAGVAVDRLTSVPTLGPVRDPGDRWGGVVGRFEGFAHTWLRPDLSPKPEHLLFLVAAACLIGSAIVARRRRLDEPLVIGLLAIAAVALLARFATDPTALIPGLVVAFPVLFAGFVLVDRGDVRTDVARVLAVFVALSWGAVLATQYRTGGGGEWGGRYFAVALPAAVALASVSLVRVQEGLTGPVRRRFLGLAAVVILLPVVMGILGLQQARERTAALTGRVQDELVDPGDGGRPVVVTTLPGLGRWSWEDVDEGRWLLVEDDELATVGARLHELGIEQLLFVSGDAVVEREQLADWYTPIDPIPERSGSSLDRIVIPMATASERP